MGILWHSSRSSVRRSTLQEFNGTRGYAAAGAAGLGWHLTVGDNMISVHLPLDMWAYHAREVSYTRVGIELAQSMPDQAISDAQLDAAFWWIRNELVPFWGARGYQFDPGNYEFHSTSAPGIRDGKSDPFPRGSASLAELDARIRARL